MKRLYAFSAIVVAVCAAAFSPAAFAVSPGDFLAEAGIGALYGYGAAGFGHIGVAVDAVSKPFLTAWVYNMVKKPAAAGESRLAVDPYVCTATTSDGGAVPLYGVTLSF